MKYVKQFGIILLISFIGEILNHLLPLPIPAGIYGLVLLFLCLQFKIIPISAVRETGTFLIEIMPIMLIPAAAGLMESWGVLKPIWLPIGAITIFSTILVMIISGKVTQTVIKLSKQEDMNNE